MSFADDMHTIVEDSIFKRAVIAVAFSPRLTAVLNESYKLSKKLGAWPIIVHVGEESPATRVRLDEAIQRSSFKHHPPITIVRQGNPVDVLVQVAKEQDADLIIAGALSKEGVFKYYLGSIARNLARQAPMSVLLLTDPQVKPNHLTKIQCAVEYNGKGEKAAVVASRLAYFCDTRDLYYTLSFSVPDWEETRKNADRIKDIYNREDETLHEFLDSVDLWSVPYQARCLNEQNRGVTLNFAREIGADLLIVPGPEGQLSLWNRLFPQNFELAMQHLPCSLLLVR